MKMAHISSEMRYPIFIWDKRCFLEVPERTLFQSGISVSTIPIGMERKIRVSGIDIRRVEIQDGGRIKRGKQHFLNALFAFRRLLPFVDINMCV